MEGIKEKSSSEEKRKNSEKTEVGVPVSSSQEPPSLLSPRILGQPSGRIHELRALLMSTEYPKQNWPGEALKSVIQRFVRMPRTGWQVFKEIYNEKFREDVPIDELKKRAEPFIASQGGVKCSRKRFITESSKRLKGIDTLIEENTLLRAKMVSRVKEAFHQELALIKLKKITEVPRTRKILSESLDQELLEIIDQEINGTLSINPPSSWEDIVPVIQAAQHCYQKITQKEKKESKWAESIQSKIEGSKSKVELIKRYDAQAKPDARELKESRRIMRELNLILQIADDRTKAIDILEQKAAVFQGKLDTYARRKEFRKDNMCFELYRFLNDEGQQAEHAVDKNEVKRFWETMWNQSNTESNDYSRYLYNFIPDSNSEEVFPSIQEFLTIVSELPSWKAAGPDGIYNFFIKKCSSLHMHLYRLVKATCMGEIKGKNWFYTGITYLIPKGSPTKGSDFRPITCMSNLYKLTTKCVIKVLQEVVENRGLLSENQLGTVRRVQGAK